MITFKRVSARAEVGVAIGSRAVRPVGLLLASPLEATSAGGDVRQCARERTEKCEFEQAWSHECNLTLASNLWTSGLGGEGVGWTDVSVFACRFS